MNSSYKKLPVVSLFSGAGGFDLGLESSNFMETHICVEMEKSYFETLKINQGKKLLGIEFLSKSELFNSNVMSNDIQDFIKEKVNKLYDWMLVGGPPCQSFSSIGKRELLSDPRGQLTPFFFDMVLKHRPRFFIFENVPMVGQKYGENLRSEVFSKLDKYGYNYCQSVVNLADYGCFTKRKRYFIIGDRDKSIKFPRPTHSENFDIFLKKWKRSSDALLGIPDPYFENDLTHHDPIFHTQEVSDRFKSLKLGEYDRKRHRSKLDPDQPAPTLVAGGNSGYVHHIHWETH
jgi:DNA (cytosine-5)-methyltransferase 1